MACGTNFTAGNNVKCDLLNTGQTNIPRDFGSTFDAGRWKVYMLSSASPSSSPSAAVDGSCSLAYQASPRNTTEPSHQEKDTPRTRLIPNSRITPLISTTRCCCPREQGNTLLSLAHSPRAKPCAHLCMPLSSASPRSPQHRPWSAQGCAERSGARTSSHALPMAARLLASAMNSLPPILELRVGLVQNGGTKEACGSPLPDYPTIS